jgi:hypothetical protein
LKIGPITAQFCNRECPVCQNSLENSSERDASGQDLKVDSLKRAVRDTSTDLRKKSEVLTMYVDYVFVCNSSSLKNCVRNKKYICSGEQVDVAQDIETDAVVSLYVSEANTLIGPFTVVDEPRANLQPGTWDSSIDRSSISENIKVEWEELHELKNAQEKFSFLKEFNTCSLAQSQIQEMLDALKEAPRLQTVT